MVWAKVSSGFLITDQEAGQYRFRLVAEGKSARLIIGKKLIVNAEGRGKAAEASGTADLAAGTHEMFLDYLQTTGSNGLQLFITPPGGGERVFRFIRNRLARARSLSV